MNRHVGLVAGALERGQRRVVAVFDQGRDDLDAQLVEGRFAGQQ